MNRNAVCRRPRGFTLVEAAVALAVTAVIAGLAVPGFEAVRQRRHLEGAAAQLETDLQLARSAAVAHAAVVRVDFEQQGGASCYVLHTGNAGDCSCAATSEPVCQGAARALRSVRYQGLPLTLASNVRSMAFEPTQGTVTPTATVRVTVAGGDAIHQIVNVMGRVRSCTPNGVPGYRAC